MKNNDDRILAYTLSKEISYEELEKVSGGSGSITSTHPCLKPSGYYPGGMDAVVDISIDF